MLVGLRLRPASRYLPVTPYTSAWAKKTPTDFSFNLETLQRHTSAWAYKMPGEYSFRFPIPSSRITSVCNCLFVIVFMSAAIPAQAVVPAILFNFVPSFAAGRRAWLMQILFSKTMRQPSGSATRHSVMCCSSGGGRPAVFSLQSSWIRRCTSMGRLRRSSKSYILYITSASSN